MSKRKIFVIFEYILTTIIAIYSLYKSVFLLVNLVNKTFTGWPYLTGMICFFCLFIACVVILTKMTIFQIYKKKFTKEVK